MKKCQNFSMLIVVSMIIVVFISNLTISYTFAAKPYSGFKSSANCSWSETTWNIKTCCWSESNGVTPGESYCQSCTMGGSDMGAVVTCEEP